jgi:hypothetical protein
MISTSVRGGQFWLALPGAFTIEAPRELYVRALLPYRARRAAQCGRHDEPGRAGTCRNPFLGARSHRHPATDVMGGPQRVGPLRTESQGPAGHSCKFFLRFISKPRNKGRLDEAQDRLQPPTAEPTSSSARRRAGSGKREGLLDAGHARVCTSTLTATSAMDETLLPTPRQSARSSCSLFLPRKLAGRCDTMA